MQDPRLAEIAFLTDVERWDVLHVRASNTEDRDGATRSPGNADAWNRYSMSASHWRDMIVDLVLRELIVEGVCRQPATGVTEIEFEGARRALTYRVMSGGMANVNVSHAGRVHLWNLRDALLRDPDLEPFGLRSRAAWERELFVHVRFASALAPLSVMFLDLDNFGAVNKTHGATVGDATLRTVFGLIKNIVGTRGAAYRYGGEEVGVLLPGVSLSDSTNLAQELCVTIERETVIQVPQLSAAQTASIGVMAFSSPSTNDDIVSKVDALMRAAKKAGKNRVESSM